MNLLFLTENNIYPPRGGTSRITVTLSKGFEERGHRCFLAFGQEGLSGDNLKRTLEENSIDIVFCNLVTIQEKKRVLPVIYDLTRGTSTKVFGCFHAMPGEELTGNSIENCLYRIKLGGELIRNIKDMILWVTPKPLVKFVFSSRLKNRYRVLSDNSDKVILLSETQIRDFTSLAQVPDGEEMFFVVPNALSFNDFLDESELSLKQKEVLILCRMDEKSKRISDALRIWKKVCEDPVADDWKLTIVGGGSDLDYFKRKARSMGLGRVSFEGMQENDLQYYKRASIFMMTSAYEGWGITLTEAQQMGAVPIAFHSYTSLTDIIEDGKNGVIVRYKDLDEYSRKILNLMEDNVARNKMAREAIASSHRFSLDVILDRWEKLF